MENGKETIECDLLGALAVGVHRHVVNAQSFKFDELEKTAYGVDAMAVYRLVVQLWEPPIRGTTPLASLCFVNDELSREQILEGLKRVIDRVDAMHLSTSHEDVGKYAGRPDNQDK